MLASLALAFVAGALSVLSPCVLPILPLVFGAAAAEHRLGPLALAAGLALSFTLIGLFVATIGFGIGLDLDVFRMVAAVLLLALGAVLVVPRMEARLAMAAGPATSWAHGRLAGLSTTGTGGQFALGLVLGAIWIPCTGPTLGTAALLASRGESLVQVAATMLVFGIGAGLPLVAIGFASREALIRWRTRLATAGSRGRFWLGIAAMAIGALILTGLDRRLETALVEASPAWLTDLTTRF